ncbi:hypothetical protein IGB42_04152 [Andreprevotia sp. IGB-42]|uniref:hypothetical protein n=1 Tax=Andreprevotia sp. IGB-42 TaxID=2497473 RepID=UPI00135ACA93|nr:hypothetical protein [Andreprevotia sp. IGB-42]KAF0811386.1 hypothetical protein IGB42_04152 [Andreprevotia sp. IGB-42]
MGIARPQEKISDFTISADGHFDVSAADCRFSGQLVQYAATAVFEARAEATGASCKYTAPLLGLVTPLSVIDGKARLAFQLDTADDVQTAVFVVNKQ